MFNPNINQKDKDCFSQIFGIPIVDNIQNYLSLPNHIGHAKNQCFNFIIDRIVKKLKTWKVNSLSFIGRATLIKAVAQSIPTYVMSSSMLP